MQRKTEAELMIDRYQAVAYANADFSASDDSFINRLIWFINQSGNSPLAGDFLIVDLGCGPGNITQRLARTWPKAHIFGIDGSQAMLDIALERKELSKEFFGNIDYFNLDINCLVNSNLGLTNSANLIVSNSLLHHLHDPQILWKSIHFLAAPGAIIFFRDLQRPLSIEKALEMQKMYVSEAPLILKRDYLASLQAAFTIDEVRAQIRSGGLDFLHVCGFQDRYLEIFGRYNHVDGRLS